MKNLLSEKKIIDSLVEERNAVPPSLWTGEIQTQKERKEFLGDIRSHFHRLVENIARRKGRVPVPRDDGEYDYGAPAAEEWIGKITVPGVVDLLVSPGASSRPIQGKLIHACDLEASGKFFEGGVEAGCKVFSYDLDRQVRSFSNRTGYTQKACRQSLR